MSSDTVAGEALTPAGPAVAVAFGTYLAVVLGIGIYASRRASDGLTDFFLAGRRLGRVVVALSAVVSGRSAWLLLGFSGLAFATGVSAVWSAAGYITVEALMFWTMAPRLRAFSEAHGCITIPDFFAARFPRHHRAVRISVVAVILVFLVSYVAAQFVAGGTAFSSSFGWDPTTGLWITAAIVLGYTVLGGFLAVSLTDLLQLLCMVLALVALPVVALVHIGGFGKVVDALRDLDPTLVDPAALGIGAMIGALGIGLGSPGSPHILVRYMSIDDPKHLRASAWIALAGNTTMAAGALAIGLLGRVHFGDVSALPGADREAVYTAMAAEYLHPVLFGFVVAAVFAAIMSTADSQLLVCASSVVRDLGQRTLGLGQELTPKQLVQASRLVITALVVTDIALALQAKDLVYWFVLFSWAGLGAALGPAALLALFWKRTTGVGVVCGVVVGTGVVVVWKLTDALRSEMYELVPGFGLAGVAVVVGSLVSREE